VTFETVFFLLYANGLLLLSLGLHRIGRIDPSPWAGRVLAGHRLNQELRVSGDEHRTGTSSSPGAHGADVARDGASDGASGDVGGLAWPQDQQPRIYTALATVAAAAAAVLAFAGVARHHHGVGVVLLALTEAAALSLGLRLSTGLRS
jgi:hypothetical protein